jgi:hypothetical protein
MTQIKKNVLSHVLAHGTLSFLFQAEFPHPTTVLPIQQVREVSAAGANGEQVTNFKLKMTTSFGKLMNLDGS